jgi:competence protein ComEA
MDGGIRDWLSGLSRRELVLLGVVGLTALGGVGLWYVRSLPRPVEVQAPRAGPSVSPSPASLIIHVAGWVRRPGVYELPQGSRVIDAVEMAGGPRNGAELGTLNLAAPLSDGQQVLVAKQAGPAGAGTLPAAPGASPSGGATLVNVNTATAEELDTLPGIGEVLAAEIIAYREEQGPFSAVDQLVDVSGIGEVTLEEIRDLVTV